MITDKPSLYMWHLWGESSDLEGKSIQIVATKDKTGERLRPFTASIPHHPNDNKGSVSSLIEMVFPSKGIWQLEVYVHDVQWGTVEVKVRDRVFDFRRGATRYSPPDSKPSF